MATAPARLGPCLSCSVPRHLHPQLLPGLGLFPSRKPHSLHSGCVGSVASKMGWGQKECRESSWGHPSRRQGPQGCHKLAGGTCCGSFLSGLLVQRHVSCLCHTLAPKKSTGVRGGCFNTSGCVPRSLHLLRPRWHMKHCGFISFKCGSDVCWREAEKLGISPRRTGRTLDSGLAGDLSLPSRRLCVMGACYTRAPWEEGQDGSGFGCGSLWGQSCGKRES